MKASKAAIRIMKLLGRIDRMLTFLIEDMGYTVFANGTVSRSGEELVLTGSDTTNAEEPEAAESEDSDLDDESEEIVEDDSK